MFNAVISGLNDFAHLFFPHNCMGCGSDVLQQEQLLCAKCFAQLPETGFFQFAGNRVEKIFYGRLTLQQAGSAFYFTKNSLLQNLIFELKYRNNREAGALLGKLAGLQMQQGSRFDNIDVLVPLPLNARKEKKRGFNQAALIAKGMAAVLQKPVLPNAVSRSVFTETQTHKNRVSRWQNMQDAFLVKDRLALEGKHVLLVDDVVTTGATLDACGAIILEVPGTVLSIATVAYTSR